MNRWHGTKKDLVIMIMIINQWLESATLNARYRMHLDEKLLASRYGVTLGLDEDRRIPGGSEIFTVLRIVGAWILCVTDRPCRTEYHQHEKFLKSTYGITLGLLKEAPRDAS